MIDTLNTCKYSILCVIRILAKQWEIIKIWAGLFLHVFIWHDFAVTQLEDVLFFFLIYMIVFNLMQLGTDDM